MTDRISLKNNKTVKTEYEPEVMPGCLDTTGRYSSVLPEMKNTNIINISSNKGGAGKTSIAVVTGIYFSKIKKEPTLLLELDSSPGDFSILFDIDPDKTLEMAIRFPGQFYKYIKRIGDNIDVMGGIKDPIRAEKIESSDFYGLMIALQKNYKNIIIDTQTVINGLMIDAYLLSDKIILVTDYSIESIGRILVLYNILSRDLSIPVEKIDIIINKKKIFDFLKIWDYTKIAGIPLAGFISFDKRFSKSFFLSNYKRVCGTRFYRQIKRFIENES